MAWDRSPCSPLPTAVQGNPPQIAFPNHTLSLEVPRTRSHLTLTIRQTFPSQQNPSFPEQQLLFSIPSLMRDLSETQPIIALRKQGCKMSIDQFAAQVAYPFPHKTALKGKGKERSFGIAFKYKLSSANGWSRELTPLLPRVPALL